MAAWNVKVYIQSYKMTTTNPTKGVFMAVDGVVVRLLISPGGTTSGRGAAAKAAVEKRES